MAKFIADIVLEQPLNYIANNVTEIYVCTSQPADRAAAISAAVASKTGLSSANFSAVADGDTSGRKITKSAESITSASGSGDANHVALCSGTTLLHVTTVTTQTITSGNPVEVGAYDVEFADVTP